MIRTLLAAGVATAVLLSAGNAVAAPDLIQAFGHTVEVRAEAFMEVLVIDGQRIHEDFAIALDAVEPVAGTLAVVARTSGGGNMCGFAPFVVLLPEGQQPVISGPAETCADFRLSIEDNRIVYMGYPTPLGPAEQWIWTPADGFVEAKPIPFTYESGLGWGNLEGAAIDHPFDLFYSAEFAAQAAELLGKSREIFLTILSGPGEGAFRGQVYVGSACFPHNCPYAQAFFLADMTNQRLFLAWNIEGREVQAPQIWNWPDGVVAILEEWRATR